MALLSDGSIHIDQGNMNGGTPLMIASFKGHSGAVRILLKKGANVSIPADYGLTALHISAKQGHLAVSRMLVEAGADLEAATSDLGDTPLHMAAERGHHEVMSMLIEAGANPDHRRWEGATPLFMAAQNGHTKAVKVLLRAKADPLLPSASSTAQHWTSSRAQHIVPLDVAAKIGNSEVVRELLQKVGIEGCGGVGGGVYALCLATTEQHLDIMALLTDAGVVDNGISLAAATEGGQETSVKFLLQQNKGDAYVNSRGGTPLLLALGFGGISSPSPRMVRLLVEAGVDTTSAVRVTNTRVEVGVNGTPLVVVSHVLREKKIAGKDATEEQLHRLEGIRRLLLRVEAVHAVSFLWPVGIPSMIGTAEEGTNRKKSASTPLRMVLPILRRRARRPRVLLAALVRWVVS